MLLNTNWIAWHFQHHHSTSLYDSLTQLPHITTRDESFIITHSLTHRHKELKMCSTTSFKLHARLSNISRSSWLTLILPFLPTYLPSFLSYIPWHVPPSHLPTLQRITLTPYSPTWHVPLPHLRFINLGYSRRWGVSSSSSYAHTRLKMLYGYQHATPES